MGRPYSKAQGGAAIVVAAADTPGVLKSRADLVCAGTSSTGGDEDSINAALGRADAVILCPGTFWVSGSISLGTGQALSGCGPSSIIKVRNNHNANLNVITNPSSSVDHITVRNLKIDGNKTNQTSGAMNGVYFNLYVTNTQITDCFGENMYGGSAIAFYGQIGMSPLAECRLAIMGNFLQENVNGIRLVGAHQVLVQGNTCFKNDQYGMWLTWFSNDNSIVGNISLLNSQAAPNAYSDIYLESRSNQNIIQANSCKPRGTHNGETPSKYGIEIDDCHDNLVVGNDLYDETYSFKTAALYNLGTNIIKNNRGYNPVGISSITVGASPYTYTAGASPETVYVSGGTVTSITKSGNNFGLTSGAFNLEPYESIVVTYTVKPTMYKDVH